LIKADNLYKTGKNTKGEANGKRNPLISKEMSVGGRKILRYGKNKLIGNKEGKFIKKCSTLKERCNPIFKILAQILDNLTEQVWKPSDGLLNQEKKQC